VTKQSYIHSSLDVVLYLPFHIHIRVENVLKQVLFYVHDIKIMVEEICLPTRKLMKIFALLNYESNQNQETFAYQIENQTPCHHILTPHHTIIHLKDVAV
jgi:hypothetical protein